MCTSTTSVGRWCAASRIATSTAASISSRNSTPRHGNPAFSKWAQPAAPVAASTVALYADTSPRATTGQLAPLEDPFSRDLSVSAAHGSDPSGDFVGLSTSGGLPASGRDVVGLLASSSDVSGALVVHPSSATVVPYAPRGPPAPHLPS